ncbi:MAG: hypothetical protein Kow00108_19340 [Calditrichia bacterium]
MAKEKTNKKKVVESNGKKMFSLPLKRENYLILLAGVVLIAIGYILMGLPDDPDAFLTKSLSPLILVISYTVIIPIGILYRKK